MAEMTERRRGALSVRAVRHVGLTTALVFVTCAVVIVLSAISYAAADRQLSGLSARASGHITKVDGSTVEAAWATPDGAAHTVRVPLSIDPPKVGTGTDIAYDPADPARAIVPGAQVLVDGDRATTGLVLGALIIVIVLGYDGWRLWRSARLTRRKPTKLLVRRVRIQRGVLTRSYLELDDESAWLPVYYDPVLVRMPAPTTVTAYGDPKRDRLVAAEFDGVVLYPPGRVVRREPPGRRGDNPSRPDDTVAERARSVSGLGRQLRVDAVACIAAPFIGLLWAYADQSGFAGWLGATVLTASAAFWVWAIRGSDPS
ncbi:hypothetical protein [Labedaea rhizosphaerae]|uniref:DUF3592 domain-containing protein n=1 Tax=Labedaea rhizosphaerae TaxID=598644 RepID=A0A4R6SN07_LABRH|nr:hypothetical protein [Labedaea rhizosphaerae]TDQ05698.1 hypothetical protein EV186_1011676 [Labedaea rhizosphaerae]